MLDKVSRIISLTERSPTATFVAEELRQAKRNRRGTRRSLLGEGRSPQASEREPEGKLDKARVGTLKGRTDLTEVARADGGIWRSELRFVKQVEELG